MASAAAITSSVNAVAAQQTTVVVVPQTGYQLNDASVQAIEPDGVTFSWSRGRPARGRMDTVARTP